MLNTYRYTCWSLPASKRGCLTTGDLSETNELNVLLYDDDDGDYGFHDFLNYGDVLTDDFDYDLQHLRYLKYLFHFQNRNFCWLQMPFSRLSMLEHWILEAKQEIFETRIAVVNVTFPKHARTSDIYFKGLNLYSFKIFNDVTNFVKKSSKTSKLRSKCCHLTRFFVYFFQSF